MSVEDSLGPYGTTIPSRHEELQHWLQKPIEELLKYVPKLSRVEGFYSKTNIGMYDEGFFAPSVDTFYGYNVGFELGGGVEIIWSTRWIYQPVGGDLSDVEAQKQINFATVISF